VIGFMLVTGTPLWAALTAAMFPYIPGDIVKCLVAAWLATKIKI
ncbi:MAG: biotin transporter BioY, partial [Veillonella sp.]|nr:biotin transporter BioY [Veillonella sp.]